MSQGLSLSPNKQEELVERMPPKLLILISNYAKGLGIPLLGWGSFLALIEGLDIANKPVWAVIGTIIIAFISYLGIRANAKTKIEVVGIQSKIKEHEISQEAALDKANITLQIFDRAMLEAEKTRTHFSEELKAQREFFSEKLLEARSHYEKREEEIREAKHAQLKDEMRISVKYITKATKMEANLKSLGIQVSEDGEITLPATFERRKPDDSSS